MANFNNFVENILIKKIQIGNFEDCINFYERNIKLDFTDKSIFIIACSYSKRGDYSSAINLFRKGFKKFNRPEYLIEIGKNYIKFNNYKKSVKYLKFYLLKKPDSITGKYYLGISYKYCNDLENALFYLISYIKTKDDYNTWYYIEEILFELKRYKESILAGNEVIRLNEKFYPAIKIIAKSYYELDDHQNSLKYFQNFENKILLEKNNFDLETMYYCSKILISINNDKQGRKYIFKILEISPANIETLEMLFFSYLKYNDNENCIITGERILKIKIEFKIIAHLAIIYYRMNKFEESNKKVEILLKHGYESILAFKILVTYFIESEKFDAAFYYMEKIINLEKSRENDYLYAFLLFKLKKYEESKKIYYELVKNNKLDFNLRFEYSKVLYALNENIEAFNNLKFILDRDINNEEALFLLAQICFKYLDFITASEYLEKFILINKKNDQAWFLLGLCYENKNDFINSIKCINKAFKIKPDDNYKKKRSELIKKFYINYGR